MLRASHILIAHEDATRSQRNVSREEALFLIADIQKKMLDNFVSMMQDSLRLENVMILSKRIFLSVQLLEIIRLLITQCCRDLRHLVLVQILTVY